MHPNDGRVVSSFIVQALRGLPITIHGDGRQSRSFCYVSELVDGLVQLMALPDDPGPINLGNPEEITIAELAQRILELTGSRSPLVHLPLPIDDPVRRRPDVARARGLFGWAPTVAIEEGLRTTIDYFRRLA
jgi:UDP-glucuronate decarboxylase